MLLAARFRLARSAVCARMLSTSPAVDSSGGGCRLELFDGCVAVLTLNRPRGRNAFSVDMLREMNTCISCLISPSSEFKDARALVVQSQLEKVFCAGADLNERMHMNDRQVDLFVTELRLTLNKIATLDLPTIAAVSGAAIGGGAELALACDIRVAGKSARFAFPETKLGIFPGAGGTLRLPRVVGIAKAKELIFTGRLIEAQEALQIGLVNSISECASKGAYDLAKEISKNGPVGVRMGKRSIDLSFDVPIKTGLDIERACYAQLIPTKDRTEGLSAFLEKRSPLYQGE